MIKNRKNILIFSFNKHTFILIKNNRILFSINESNKFMQLTEY